MAETVAKQDAFKGFSLKIQDKLENISGALPQGFNKVRFTQNAIALLNDKPDIAKKYTPVQVMSGLVRGAMLGLDFFNKEAYLVGYGDDLQYQTSYIGAQKLVKKYSIRPVKHIYAELVREGDTFETGIDHNQRFVSFKPMPFNNKPIVGTFAVVEFEDGEILVETMNMDEVESIRKKSKMGNAGAWKDFTGEMIKKSVIRRICKRIEIDFENPEQRQIFEADTDIATDPVEVRDTEIASDANSVDFPYEDAVVKPVVE